MHARLHQVPKLKSPLHPPTPPPPRCLCLHDARSGSFTFTSNFNFTLTVTILLELLGVKPDGTVTSVDRLYFQRRGGEAFNYLGLLRRAPTCIRITP